jgi:hypothetical protein
MNIKKPTKPGRTSHCTGAFFRPGIGAFLTLTAFVIPGVVAQTNKILFNYFKPTPIVCSPLTSSIWGASGVLPRDKCNGLQDLTGTQTIAPTWLYWDGKILKAKDGKYHLFASRWPQSQGHNGGWGNSDIVHAVSDSSPIGPYVDKGYAYSNGPDKNDSHKGHNVSVVQLPDSTYAMVVSEIVPFTIFTAKSLDGPWTNLGHAQINTNGVPVTLLGQTNIESNISLMVRPDGTYEIIQRHGVIAISTTGLLGPYKVQQPTNTYPASEQPPSNLATIYPTRQKHTSDDPTAPASVENTQVLAEDPLIWFSGGMYHVLYDYPDDRVGYHLTSLDGIHNWTDQGFAFDPRQAKQLFSYSDGTVEHWFKMERPNIYMENGHIKFFTFAVTDVDKGQITGGSNHGNNVIVMSVDGATFDTETGVVGIRSAEKCSNMSPIAASLFIESRSIRYSIASASRVSIKIVTTLGRVVATPVNSVQQAGWYTVSVPDAVPTGGYIVAMKAGRQTMNKLAVINR